MSKWIYAIDGDWPDYDNYPNDLEEVLFCIEDKLSGGLFYRIGFFSDEHGQTFAHGIDGCIANRVVAFMRIPNISLQKIEETKESFNE